MYALNGIKFKEMVWAALSWLRQHQAAINALNVFPVPDGDTGTNMTLTMTSAWNEIANLEEENIGRLAGKMAHGALMGARGNSGVILSQIWRGLARSLDSKQQMYAVDLVHAIREAADTAYKGVVKPVEGTILTVIRETAEEAETAIQATDDLHQIFNRMVERAKIAEARTPAMLPVLKQAGVVDSGGQGLVIILEGMWRQLSGLSTEENGRLTQVVDLIPRSHTNEELLDIDLEEAKNFSYDVQFILIGENMDVELIRTDICNMGRSGLIVGDSTTIKVHIHVPDPGVPISYGVKQGSLRDVVVEDMQAQYQEFIMGREEHPVLGPQDNGSENTPPPIGVVAVSAGDGLDKVFRSLGVTSIVPGGETMNPSTAQILEAVNRLKSEKVLILPNNKNIILAAQQAAEVCKDKAVAVVPTKNIPQGVAALLALDPEASLDSNVSSMLQAAQNILSGGVTQATRSVVMNEVEVHEGDAIGLLNGDLVLAADTYNTVVFQLLERADIEDCELVTLYYGEGVDEDQASDLVDQLSERFPHLEFEIVYGGQPHYPYLLSIE